MAMREIDEVELTRLQSVNTVVARMLANPESRKKVLEAHKIQNPNAVVPELDAAKPFNEALGTMAEQVKELSKKIDADKAEREQNARKAELDTKWSSGRMQARKAGYTEEGVKALEEFMVEKGVLDHDVAMPAFERTQPAPTQIDNSKQGFDAFKAISNSGEEMKRLLDTQGQDNGVVRDLISKSLSDVRTGGR